MIRRVISLLLMPLMLANQGLCLAHAHHDSQPPDHASRPHIHSGSHSHGDADHGHDHDAVHAPDNDADHSHESAHHPDEGAAELVTATPVLRTSAPDHEHDAVYFAVTTPITLKTDSAVKRLADDQAAGWMLCVEASEGTAIRPWPVVGPPLALFDADCPIFLRTLSLRL